LGAYEEDKEGDGSPEDFLLEGNLEQERAKEGRKAMSSRCAGKLPSRWRREADRSRSQLTFRSGAVTSGCRKDRELGQLRVYEMAAEKRERRTNEESLERPDEVEETDWREGDEEGGRANRSASARQQRAEGEEDLRTSHFWLGEEGEEKGLLKGKGKERGSRGQPREIVLEDSERDKMDSSSISFTG